MNTKILKTCIFILLITVVVATPIGVRAQTEAPPVSESSEKIDEIESIDVLDHPLPASFFDDDLGAIRADEIGIKAEDGDCSQLPDPTFVGEKRDLTLNEDTTHIVVLHDEITTQICVLIWGSWPGRVTNDGVSEFDTKIRVYRDNILVASEDKPLIRSNPANGVIPFHTYSWQVPCGDKEYYVLIDFWQQQILGDQRLGMPHRDWSGIYRPQLCMLYLSLIFGPPRESPVCPTNWQIRHVSPNDGDDILMYTVIGDTVFFTYFMTPEQVFRSYTEKDGHRATMENMETTLYGPDRTIEFGNASYIELRNLGMYTYTLESSFITSEGLRCWNHVRIYDPPGLLTQQLIEANPDLNWDETYDLALEMYNSQIKLGLDVKDAYEASKILLNK